MCASCVLPKKVAIVVWVFDSALIGNDGCYLCASCMLPSTLLLQEQAWLVHSRNSPIIFFKAILDWNSHLLAYFSRKHAGSTHACYLRASFCCTINGSCCMSIRTEIKTFQTRKQKQLQRILIIWVSVIVTSPINDSPRSKRYDPLIVTFLTTPCHTSPCRYVLCILYPISLYCVWKESSLMGNDTWTVRSTGFSRFWLLSCLCRWRKNKIDGLKKYT